MKYVAGILGDADNRGRLVSQKSHISKFPIRKINKSRLTDSILYDRMVSLVEQMLVLHKQLPQVGTPHEKTALHRQIEATDGQIDALV